MSKINKRQIVEAGDTAVIVANNTQNSYTTLTTRLTATLTSAPPGDYLVDLRFAVMPTGSGNSTLNVTTDSTGTLTTNNIGIHASDADFSTTKFAHRNYVGMLKSHPGGTFTVTATHSPESAVATQYGNSGDGRWATTLRITKAG